ncbi:hypothetical protein LEMLEM_LOCUS2826, partial [Lemmus lemmus]
PSSSRSGAVRRGHGAPASGRRRRKAQRKGKGRTEAARAAAPVPSGCAGARREARAGKTKADVAHMCNSSWGRRLTTNSSPS